MINAKDALEKSRIMNVSKIEQSVQNSEFLIANRIMPSIADAIAHGFVDTIIVFDSSFYNLKCIKEKLSALGYKVKYRRAKDWTDTELLTIYWGEHWLTRFLKSILH